MPAEQFAIYQTGDGFTAVTHPVQREILAALEEGDKQLPELVEITGKSKPTLSSTHVKELLNRELVVELPHPRDARRKYYRLNAQRIGSSDIPVAQLRAAVKQYASLAGERITPVATAIQILAAAPAEAPAEVLAAQAEALGRLAGPRVEAQTVRDIALRFGEYLEKEGLAELLQIDLEAPSFRCRPGPGTKEIDPARLALLLAAFGSSVFSQVGHPEARLRPRPDSGDAFVISA